MTVPQKHVLQESTGYGISGNSSKVTFYYTTADPHAFQLTVHQHGGEVEWGAARELLRDAWNAERNVIVGEGDLKLMRYQDDGPEMVSFQFTSPDGVGYLDLPWGDVGMFSVNVFNALPYDYEMEDAEIDATIERLLA